MELLNSLLLMVHQNLSRVINAMKRLLLTTIAAVLLVQEIELVQIE